jgi:hypothetical protein
MIMLGQCWSGSATLAAMTNRWFAAAWLDQVTAPDSGGHVTVGGIGEVNEDLRAWSQGWRKMWKIGRQSLTSAIWSERAKVRAKVWAKGIEPSW